MEKRKIQTKSFYRHFKGRIYFVHYIAKHTETGEQMVVYQAAYGMQEIYVRPYDMFASEVDRDKYPDIKQEYRFELMSGQEIYQANQPELIRFESQF